MNKVELSLDKYEEMRDRIEELEKVVETHDESGKYVVKNIIQRTETVGNTIQRVLHTHYTIHDEDELKTLIAGSEVLKMKSQIASYERRIKSLDEKLKKYDTRKKWYQFWK